MEEEKKEEEEKLCGGVSIRRNPAKAVRHGVWVLLDEGRGGVRRDESSSSQKVPTGSAPLLRNALYLCRHPVRES